MSEDQWNEENCSEPSKEKGGFKRTDNRCEQGDRAKDLTLSSIKECYVKKYDK